MSKVIKGGTVVTADRTWEADVLIEGEKIAAIGENLSGDETIDASDAYVIPGGIDPHTHLEMPFMGTTAAETFESGTWAAATGGTTMLVDFVLPGEDGSLVNALDDWDRKSKDQICVDIGYHMAVVDWNEKVHTEMGEAVKRGVNTFKHFMAYKGALMIEDVHHGFRTTASTNLNEMGWNADWIERQLAHVPANKVRSSYNKAEYLEGRVEMMAEYSKWLEAWQKNE